MAWRSSPEASVGTIRRSQIDKPVSRIAVCIAAVFAVTALIYVVPLERRPLSSALAYLFVVLIVSAVWGFRYSLFLSLLATVGFSWLLPPGGRFWLTDPRDVLVLAAFLVIGITTSRLSDRARREVVNANLRSAEAVAAQKNFADLLNSVEGIVWEADAQSFVFSFVSEQAEAILGYPVEQWLREPTFWKDHLHPEDREWAVQFCAQATAGKQSHDFEHRMIAADGRVVWLRDLVTVVAENGRASRLRGVMIDITKRKQADETLREQANLLSLTHDAIFVRDPSGTIQYWNRGAEEMYGWAAKEASGKVSHQLLKTVFPAPLGQIEGEFVRAGRWEGELAHTKKDGTQIFVASRWSLQRDSTGAPAAVIVTNNDITERKRAEKAREEIEELWRAAFESNPTMYFIVDAAGEIESVNAFGAEQLGYTVSELVGQPVLNIFYEPDRQAIQGHANACFERPGRMMGWEARKIRKDGTMLWVRETGNAVFLRNRPVLLVVCEDITEQKRAEEAALRSENELRDVIETIPAMAFSIRPDGSTEFVNQRALEYTGLSEETISEPGWQSTIHTDDLARHVSRWRASMASGEPFENEVRHRNANGEYRWFLVRAVPLRDEHGNISKWYGILTDIEDRKRAEALLTGEKRILEMVAKGDSLAQILDSLCRLAEEQASGVLASILLLDGNCLRHGGAPSLPKAYTDAIDGAAIGPAVGSCGTAAYRGEQVIVEDIATDPLWADYREAALPHSLRACWSTPIFSSQGKVSATFAMYYREPRSPSLRDQEIIEQITHLAGAAIERRLTQEALRRSETYLAEAQRLSQTGSWAWDPRGDRMLYCSEEIYRIFGIDPHEHVLSIELLLQRVHPDDRERVRAESVSGSRLKAEHTIEYRLLLPDGTIKYVDSMRHPVFDAVGELVEIIGTIVDVTERKHAEETLRRSEAYLAEAQKLTKTGSWAANLITLQMFHASDEFIRLHGFDPGEKVPSLQDYYDCIHPQDEPAVRARVEAAIGARTDFDFEFRVVFPDGTVKHLRTTGHSHPSGEPGEYTGITVDVSERKRAEEALQRSEAYLAEAQRLARTGSWAYNPATQKAIYWSEEMFRIFGLDPHRGSPPDREEFVRLMHPEDRARFAERVEKAFREKSDFVQDFRIVLPDGTVRHLHEIGHPVLNEAGNIIEYVGTEVDVTERKRAEEGRERLRQIEADLSRINRVSMMGELTASLGHEIKQPIAAAVSNAEACLQWLARDKPDLAEVREAATEMVKEARRAAEIITRVRSLFKKEEIAHAILDVNEIIADTVSLVHEEADRRWISVRTELGAELPRISADRVQLQQVLINLMLNGLEAMKDAGGELVIRSQRSEEGHVLISVTDGGVGLPVGESNKIFDAFFTTKPQGTGMGLAISRSIVESHGGRLWATVNSGPGATFHFTLPNELAERA